ncbi:MAG: transposase, partial [Gammaproteobacteria bacterium]|nr:transposase [Gammaproteobacteria bacterium]
MRVGSADFVRRYADRGACPRVRSTLAKLSLCRTKALGGQTYQCDACGEVSDVHHSCGDRHCPVCSGRKRYDFAARAQQLILESVTYYQVVFTLPGELSELALANRLEMADLLFASSWKSLRKTIREQQDYEPAAMMVLHSWNQQLEPHWHVHALVPGGGPSLSGDWWKQAEAPEGAANSDGYYLVDVISLRQSFRRHALTHLRRLRRQGKLKLGGKFTRLRDDEAWEAFCEQLAATEWVSFIQPPPTPRSSAQQVVRYLTRYLTGGPISDRRIVAADAREVTFLARKGQRTGGERRQVPITLTTTEFIRRWC